MFDGVNIHEASGTARKELYKDIQIVFQDPYGSLNPRKRIEAILEESLLLNGNMTRGERRQRVLEILNLVELDQSYLEKYPIQLTQGEQQRIGVARAFVTRPKLVVLDEPTSLLDLRFRGEIVLLLKKLQKETGCAYLFISHDLSIVHQLSHRVGVMYLGRMVEQGEANQIFHNPQHPYTRALLSATLFINPGHRRERFQLEGEAPSPVNLSDQKCNFCPRCKFSSGLCQSDLPKLATADRNHAVACFHPEAERIGV
jgi:oligopeptide/dipeptide ABC transporter ATP-binding protein